MPFFDAVCFVLMCLASHFLICYAVWQGGYQWLISMCPKWWLMLELLGVSVVWVLFLMWLGMWGLIPWFIIETYSLWRISTLVHTGGYYR